MALSTDLKTERLSVRANIIIGLELETICI